MFKFFSKEQMNSFFLATASSQSLIGCLHIFRIFILIVAASIGQDFIFIEVVVKSIITLTFFFPL